MGNALLLQEDGNFLPEVLEQHSCNQPFVAYNLRKIVKGTGFW